MAKLIKKSATKPDVGKSDYWEWLQKMKAVASKQYEEVIAMINAEMQKHLKK